MTRTITIGILVVTTLALIAWDIYVYVEPTLGDTISEVVMGFARKRPVIPFLLGVVAGHLCWPQIVKEI